MSGEAGSWDTGSSGKTPYRETRKFAGGSGKSDRNQELQALQASSLHPRSRWGQCAAFRDMRISLTIRSSESWSTDIYIYIYIYICIYIYIYVHMYISLSLSIHVYIYICIHTHVCVYVSCADTGCVGFESGRLGSRTCDASASERTSGLALLIPLSSC